MSFYKIDFPREIIEPIKAVYNKTRRQILLTLLDKSSLSYSEIKNNFQISKGTLNHHLHILVRSGLIRNFAVSSPGDPYKSYYTMTNFGHKFLDGLRQTLEPKIVRRTVIHTNSTTITDEIMEGEQIIMSASEGVEENLFKEIATKAIES